MNTTTDLVVWEVPFSKAHDPSVSVITEQGGDVVTLVIAPGGIDQYPKYLVRFAKVIALLSYEEAHAFDRGYRSLSGIDANRCAYVWAESPWLESYRRGADLLNLKDLRHYLVFGGDSIVELISSGQPKVERLDQRQIFEVKHEV